MMMMMSPSHSAAAKASLEALLDQLEQLSADLLGAMHQARASLEDGLTTEVQQKFLLRGQLLQQAQMMAKETLPKLSVDETRALQHKLKALTALHQELGDKLKAHHDSLREAMKGTQSRQKSLKGYQRGEAKKPKGFIDEA